MGAAQLRPGPKGPFVTDNEGWILDCPIPGGKTPHQLMAELHAIPGVVDAGFFLARAAPPPSPHQRASPPARVVSYLRLRYSRQRAAGHFVGYLRPQNPARRRYVW